MFMQNEEIKIKAEDLWQRTKSICIATTQSDDERNKIARYLSFVTRVKLEDSVFKILTNTKFTAEQLDKEYSEKINECFRLAGADSDLKLEFGVDEEYTPTYIQPTVTEQPKEVNHYNLKSKNTYFTSTQQMDESNTFENFVRGPSNSFARDAAEGVVKNPGKKGYNPLFIHGGTGLGKTHLMQAIGHEIKRRDPSQAVCFLSAEEFLNKYVESLQNGQIQSFRERYRSIDVLLLDDVQFFQRGKEVLEEFFNTFNALQRAQKQIVMTSDVAPKDLPAIEARLISRFEGGLVQEIESPSYETRLAILKKKAENMNAKLPDTALEFIAQNVKSHVRAMEGALSKINIFHISNPSIILDNDILSRLLDKIIENEKNLKLLSIEEIQRTVAEKYCVSITQILSSERTQSLVTPRQLAMYIARKITTKSLQEIAEAFGKKHATILHGVKTIRERLENESDLKRTLEEIITKFGYKMSDILES